ncbi:hypothetical protein [Streptomyces sp. NPDC000880]
MRQHREHMDVRTGEETELVRPYVLASEERARQRSTAPHHLLAHTCFAPAEAL